MAAADPNWPVGKGTPIPFLTAVWSGMDHAEIVAGLRAGGILPPPGAPKDWLPTYASAVDTPPVTDTSVVAAAGSADTVVDQARVKGWFDALDPKLDATSFDEIWGGAGPNDAARATTLTTYLTQTLLGKSASPNLADGSAGPAVDAATGQRLDDFLADPAHRAQVVNLAGKSGTEIATLAQTDIGYRQALDAMQPLALVGNRALFTAQNGDGHLDRFDPDTGESLLSDAWLSDRSKYLAWKNVDGTGNAFAIDGNQSWTFVDRGTHDAAGDPMRLELQSSATDATSNQVVFGSSDAEVIKGLSGTDRIYAGGGDDVVRGGVGADHLEGGAGDDLLLGGAGKDELLGNQGADDLDGGAGADAVSGGSGDDTLTGGRGDDRLDGGAGFDTYVSDAGDGTDTIVDADGKGDIVLDGASIAGTMKKGDGGWLSTDGRLEFAYNGEAQDGTTLTIKAFDVGADHSAPAANVLQVRNWKNGDLGITLDGQSVANTAQSAVAANTGAAGDAAAMTPAVAGPGAAVSIQNGDTASAGGNTDGSSGMADAAAASDGSGVGGDGAAGSGGAGSAGNGDGGPGGSGDAGSAGPADAGASAAAFDFESAIASLLGTNENSFITLDPGRLHDAIAAFSGLLEPPDVAIGMLGKAPDIAGAVTTAHVSDALANDVSSDDFEHEIGAATMMVPPELRRVDIISGQAERAAYALGSSAVGQSR